MNELDELRAEADRLKVEEQKARLALAVVHKQYEAAMLAYRSIGLRKLEVEKAIKRLLEKDSRRYVAAQKAGKHG